MPIYASRGKKNNLHCLTDDHVLMTDQQNLINTPLRSRWHDVYFYSCRYDWWEQKLEVCQHASGWTTLAIFAERTNPLTPTVALWVQL